MEDTQNVVTTQTKKVGVELIKTSINVLYGTGIELKDDLKDRRLSPGEMIALIDNLYSIGTIVVKGSQLWAEVIDVDTEEGAELLAYVMALGFLKEEAGAILTKVVCIITDVVDIVQLLHK